MTHCCIAVYFMSILVAGSSSISGAFVAATMLIVDQDILQSHPAAAAFNFAAALYGTVILCVCLSNCNKQRLELDNTSMLELITYGVWASSAVHLISFASFYAVKYYDHATPVMAACFISAAAGWAVIELSILYAFIWHYPSGYFMAFLGAATCFWGLLAAGCVISGMMIDVGQNPASDEVSMILICEDIDTSSQTLILPLAVATSPSS